MTPEQAAELIGAVNGCRIPLLIIMACIVAAFTWKALEQFSNKD